MFDTKYFRSVLPGQAAAAGADSIVEVHLIGGQGHRVHSVESIDEGYIVLAVYRRHAENSGAKTRWHGGEDSAPDAGSAELQRAVVSYESITQVVITPTPADSGVRIGFGSR